MPITEAFSAHTIRQDLQRLSQSFLANCAWSWTLFAANCPAKPPITRLRRRLAARLAARLSAADLRLALLRGLAVIYRLARHAALSLASAVRRGVKHTLKNRHRADWNPAI